MGLNATDAPPDSLLRAADPSGTIRWYIRTATGLAVTDPQWTLGSLLALPVAELYATLDAAAPVEPGTEPTLLAPVDDDLEVWAAGVTYQKSRLARMEESREPDVYQRVYAAERPELFFKAVGWRVSGPGQPVGVRADSDWNVPEPELALVCASSGDIVGYTVCNDMSSRSIEGENPLYLPQAKVYRHACALGPWIRLARAVPRPTELKITAEIRRDDEPLWTGSASTSGLRRGLDELVSFLYRAEHYPRGVVLATGTSTVPDESVSVVEGDVVTIDIEGIGRLSNPTVTV
jgi:2-dehydro-3-deoxy-D-arabinonate dehydratase